MNLFLYYYCTENIFTAISEHSHAAGDAQFNLRTTQTSQSYKELDSRLHEEISNYLTISYSTESRCKICDNFFACTKLKDTCVNFDSKSWIQPDTAVFDTVSAEGLGTYIQLLRPIVTDFFDDTDFSDADFEALEGIIEGSGDKIVAKEEQHFGFQLPKTIGKVFEISTATETCFKQNSNLNRIVQQNGIRPGIEANNSTEEKLSNGGEGFTRVLNLSHLKNVHDPVKVNSGQEFHDNPELEMDSINAGSRVSPIKTNTMDVSDEGSPILSAFERVTLPGQKMEKRKLFEMSQKQRSTNSVSVENLEELDSEWTTRELNFSPVQNVRANPCTGEKNRSVRRDAHKLEEPKLNEGNVQANCSSTQIRNNTSSGVKPKRGNVIRGARESFVNSEDKRKHIRSLMLNISDFCDFSMFGFDAGFAPLHNFPEKIKMQESAVHKSLEILDNRESGTKNEDVRKDTVLSKPNELKFNEGTAPTIGFLSKRLDKNSSTNIKDVSCQSDDLFDESSVFENEPKGKVSIFLAIFFHTT